MLVEARARSLDRITTHKGLTTNSWFSFIRCCSLELPPGARNLEFKSTPFCANYVAVSLDMVRGKREPVVIGDLALNWDCGSNRLSVRVVPSRLPSSQKIEVSPIPWWPYLRRFITETRDRALPLVPSWIQRKSFHTKLFALFGSKMNVHCFNY